MPLDLPARVASLMDACRLTDAMIARVGGGFHTDTSPEDYEGAFSSEEIGALDPLWHQAHDLSDADYGLWEEYSLRKVREALGVNFSGYHDCPCGGCFQVAIGGTMIIGPDGA